MKKTMIFAIILMPLIVLGLMFLGGSIVYRSKYLYVEKIECVDNVITLNKETSEDVSKQLKVNVYPILANNQKVDFYSDDETICVVDSEGNITSRNFGTTYVYAISQENSTKKDVCKVVVTSENVHNVWVENEVSLIYVNDELQLNTKYSPVEAKNANFEYVSSNSNVLSVSEGGALFANDKGIATITVSWKENPEINYSFDVLVKYRVEDIYILETDPVDSGVSDFVFPTINFTPTQAQEIISYWSSDPTTASVDSSGNIHFNKPGKVTIYAQAGDFDKVIEKVYTSTCGYINKIQFSYSLEEYNFEDYQNSFLPISWSFTPQDANKNNIQLESSNTSVVIIENGQIKVVGGGNATIKLSATTPSGTKTEATKHIKINRKITGISLNLPDFSYVYEHSVEVSCSFEPTDANELIKYDISDSNIATFANNILKFTPSTINNKYGKVSLTAFTDSGVFKTITIVYLDPDLPKVNICDSNDLEYDMPKVGQSSYSFALISEDNSLKDIDFEIENGSENINQNGCIFTLKNNGTAKIGVKINGQTECESYINLTINRLVEKIENISVDALWDGLSSITYNQNNKIYSSSNTFNISYSLYPENTTKTTANIEIVDPTNNIATLNGNTINFNAAGKIKVKISCDDAIEYVEIESTNLYPDSNTSVEGNVLLNKGEKFNLWDKISISPINANLNNIDFSTLSSAISIDENGIVTAIHGGEAKISVNIQTTDNIIVNTINVKITENAEGIDVIGDSYIFTENNTINVLNKFAFYPTTANANNTITIESVINSIASVSSSGDVSFKKAGSFEVIAKIDGVAEKRITIVYADDQIVVQGKQNFKVLNGTKIIIKPDSSVLLTANYNCKFEANNNSVIIENDVILTINGDAEIIFNNTKYSIDCVESIENVSIYPTNLETVDFVSKNSYITGLEQISLSASVTGVDSSYLNNLAYSVDTEYASVDSLGTVTFTAACIATITATAKYKSDIYGAENAGINASIVIESTFGQITKITTNETNLTFEFDNQNSKNNIFNVASLLSAYPTQLSVNANNIELELNNNIATINGTKICFVKGGSVSVKVKIKEQKYAANGTTIKFNVNRSATAIYLNGNELVNGETIIFNKSTIYISPIYYPADANINNDIRWEISQNDGIATANFSLGNIVFNKSNQKVNATFTMSDILYEVYFETSTITYELNILDDTYVVPVNEPFTFIENNLAISNYQVDFGAEFDNITETVSDGVYKINKSRVGSATITYNGQTKDVKIVVTSNLKTITNVSLTDVDMNNNIQTIPTSENNLCLTTASKNVRVNYEIPTGFNKKGELITYTIEVNDTNNAHVDGNNIKFLSACTVVVTIKIEYEDAYQARQIEYSFSIKSTFGNVTEFALEQTNYNYIFDTMSETDKAINFANIVTRKLPTYGEVDNFILTIDNESMASVSNNCVNINSFGTCSAIVSWGTATQKTVKIVVDKYIDDINFLDNNEIVCQIVTKSSTYQLNYSLFVNNSKQQPTLTDVTITSTGNCSVKNNGLVTFNESNSKFNITISAKQGSASKTLIITKVDSNVNIIPCNSELENIVIEKDVINIFDYRFNNNLISIKSSEQTISVNNKIDTFIATKGSEGQIILSNNQAINFIATEDPTKIIFGENAPDNDYITAMGSAEDGKQISLSNLYNPTVYPSTARTIDGNYSVACTTNNSEIAYVQGDSLIFNKAGKVTLLFSVGNVTATKEIESTFGYVKSFNWQDNSDIVVDYSSKEYSLPNHLFNAIPTDYYKSTPLLSSENVDVFDINQQDNKLIFNGGGETTLNLSFETLTGLTTIFRKVLILHRAKDVEIYDNNNLTSYMVKNFDKDMAMQLDYNVIPALKGITLSSYYLQFTSSNESVAKFNNKSQNTLTFVGNGETIVTISVLNSFDDACDASVSVKIINDSSYRILNVNNSENIEFVIELGDTNNYVLYPIPNKRVQGFNFTSSGTSVDVNALGEITLLSGGESTIQISEYSQNNAWVKTLTIYVHKNTNIVLPEVIQSSIDNNTSILTSKLTYNVGASFTTSDSLARKEFTYSSNNENVAKVSNTGVISFEKAEEVEITISVIYNNNIETTKTFKIRSSLQKAESFNIDCSQKELLVGDSVTLTINNIIPADYLGTIELETDNNQAISFEVLNNSSFKISGIFGGNGNVYVKLKNSDNVYSDVYKTIPIKVIQLSESIDIWFGNAKVENNSITTFMQEVSLVAHVLPTNATNTNVEWLVENGPASVEQTGKVTFSDYGTATIVAKAADFGLSKTQTTIQITYIKDIDGYILQYIYHDDDEEEIVTNLENNSTIYVEFNVDNIELNISVLPANLTGAIYYQYFTAQAENGSIVKINTQLGKINISLVSANTNPTFGEKITVKYKEDKEVVVNIYRDGIKSLEFIDHDNNVDKEKSGLQAIRVFGNRSYYNGIQNYYQLPIKVEPADASTSNIVWQVTKNGESYSKVTYNSELTTIDGVKFLQIYFNTADYSTMQNIYDDNFENGKVTLAAFNKTGRQLYTYTFYVVNAVNIWDEIGYVNGGSEIVLQKSLGHDDQKALIESGEYSRLDAYANKTTIYGNGHLINFAYYNNTATVTKYGYIAITLTNVINIEIQGCNVDETKSTYCIEISGPSKIAYCYMHDMYRAVELGGDATINIKNSMFRTFAHSTIIASNDGARTINLENVIMFDVGQRAIESQSADDKIYISGIFDVYNFQNKSSLSAAISNSEYFAGKIITEAKNNNMAVTSITDENGNTISLGDTWANVIIIATKQTLKNSKTKVYYNNMEDSVPSVSSITKYGYKAWATKNDHEYIKWENEFVYDVSTKTYSFNNSYMIGTMSKLKRSA